MKKILLLLMLVFGLKAQAQVDPISNGESGSSIRGKLNEVIDSVNKFSNSFYTINDIKTEDGEIITTRNTGSTGFAKLTSLSGSTMLPGLWVESEDASKGLYLLSVAEDAGQTSFTDGGFYFNTRQNDATPLTSGNVAMFANGQENQAYIDYQGGIFSISNQFGNGYASLRSNSGSVMLPSLWGRSESTAQGFSLLAFPDLAGTDGFTDAGMNITVRKNDASPVTLGNLLEVNNATNTHLRVDYDGFTQFVRSPRSFAEFVTDGADLKVAVGKIGSQEANVSFNMDYRTGVHQFYDSTINALWSFQNNNGFGMQFAADTGNSIGDIWSNNNNAFYPYIGDTAGRFAINVPSGYTFTDATLDVNGYITADSIVTDLGTADWVFENRENWSLSEHKKFTDLNNCTPEMSKARGASLGRNISSLEAELEKAYIFIYQLEKRLSELEKKNNPILLK